MIAETVLPVFCVLSVNVKLSFSNFAANIELSCLLKLLLGTERLSERWERIVDEYCINNQVSIQRFGFRRTCSRQRYTPWYNPNPEIPFSSPPSCPDSKVFLVRVHFLHIPCIPWTKYRTNDCPRFLPMVPPCFVYSSQPERRKKKTQSLVDGRCKRQPNIIEWHMQAVLSRRSIRFDSIRFDSIQFKSIPFHFPFHFCFIYIRTMENHPQVFRPALRK